MNRIRAIHDFGPAPDEYVPSERTDIRKTFRRERKRLAAKEDPRLPAWLAAHAAERWANLERTQAALERARAALDADDRR